jgi:hypothetical protein
MASDTRSRRAFLAAAAGATAATVVSAIGRPAAVRAGTDGDVVLGALNNADDVTSIQRGTTGPAIAGITSFGSAISGDANQGVGVQGNSTEGRGIYGSGGTGGVHGFSDAGYGALGVSISGSGVLGHSGPDPLSTPAKTGVHGYAAQDANARGVHGQTTGGQGVRGEATSGVGVYATATTGVALKVAGRTALSRSGKAFIAAGRSRVDVDLRARGGLTGTPLCFANLLSYRSGVYVAAARPNYPSAGKLRIYLNRAVTSSISVAWVVLN